VAEESEGRLRADAQRNRESLLAVAREVIAEQGVEASLRDVARRAGVGIGTLYRHFPTREALVQAVLSGRLEAMAETAEAALGAASPGEALFAWLRRFSAGSGAFHGLPGSVLAALRDEHSELHAACARLQLAAGRLLARAQETGEVRPGVDPADLFVAAAALGWAAQHADEGRAAGILDLLVEGLRPR
jgi:AcrR family transcriptional regulator